MVSTNRRQANYTEAMAAGRDAGNRSAAAAGRAVWNEADWDAATAVTGRLLGVAA